MTLDELATLFDLAAPHGAMRNQRQILDSLKREQLIEAKEQAWEPTARGRVFIEHIAALPLPVSQWSMPREAGAAATTLREVSLHIAAIDDDDDGPAPPAPPLKVTRHIEDPAQRQQEATRLMNAGYGMREIKEELELSDEDMSAYFGKWA